MHRVAPYTVAALVFATAALWSINLAVSPDPLAPSSASVVAIGAVLGAVIAVAGLLLSRGRWSVNLAIVVSGGLLILAVVQDPGPWYVAGLAVGGLALVGLTGPWLRGWVRKLPAAEGPGPIPVALVFASLALVPAVGVASPSGLEVTHGVLGGAGLLLGWGYGRAEPWALWGLRLALPVLAVGSIIQSPWGGRILLVALVVATTWLAWRPEASRAVNPLLDRLPGPRVASPPSGGEDQPS